MKSNKEPSSIIQTALFMLSLTIVLLAAAAPARVAADGQPPEVLASHQEESYSGEPGFVRLPAWARAHLPPLPDQLKPYGKSTDAPKPTLTSTAPSPTPTPAPAVASTAPAKPPRDDSHKNEAPLSAITPFLDWIKADPNAAAEAARREAAKYPATVAPQEPVIQGFDPSRPYWLPPLRNSTDNNSSATAAPSGADSTSSSAVYQRPSQ